VPNSRERPAREFARNVGLSFVAWMSHPCSIEPDKNSIFVSKLRRTLKRHGRKFQIDLAEACYLQID
jgi:hypothetical protein